MTKFRSLVVNAFALGLFLAPMLAVAGESHEMESAQIDLTDKAALQHGAGLYMSYCSGCHSLSYHRYSRTAADLGLTQEQVEQNLIYNDQKFGENINTGMDAGYAKTFFGKAPPDLSVEARTKEQGADWIYNYLKSFYVDESRPSACSIRCSKPRRKMAPASRKSAKKARARVSASRISRFPMRRKAV
jgi:ubiquinol-cytochrome c reductase cytochrome c1 subunit